MRKRFELSQLRRWQVISKPPSRQQSSRVSAVARDLPEMSLYDGSAHRRIVAPSARRTVNRASQR